MTGIAPSELICQSRPSVKKIAALTEPNCQSRPSISIAPTEPIFWYCGGQLKLYDLKHQNILIHEITSDQHNTRLSKTLKMSQIANPGLE